MPQSGATPQNKGREVAQLLEEKENQKKRTFEGGMMDGPTMAEEERNHQRNKKLTASIATDMAIKIYPNLREIKRIQRRRLVPESGLEVWIREREDLDQSLMIRNDQGTPGMAKSE